MPHRQRNIKSTRFFFARSVYQAVFSFLTFFGFLSTFSAGCCPRKKPSLGGPGRASRIHHAAVAKSARYHQTLPRIHGARSRRKKTISHETKSRRGNELSAHQTIGSWPFFVRDADAGLVALCPLVLMLDWRWVVQSRTNKHAPIRRRARGIQYIKTKTEKRKSQTPTRPRTNNTCTPSNNNIK